MPSRATDSIDFPVVYISTSSASGARNRTTLYRFLGFITDSAIRHGIVDTIRIVDARATLHRVRRFELRGRQSFFRLFEKPREVAVFELEPVGAISLEEVKTLVVRALTYNDGVDDLDVEPEFLEEVTGATSVAELAKVLHFGA